jgi:cytochrome c553
VFAASVAAVLIGLAVLAAVAMFGASERILARTYQPRPERLAMPTPQQIADAPRQARILGCLSCHGDRLEGKLMADIPNVVRLHAPNLTAIAARASDQQLAAAIRQGIGHDGRGLFVMPSPMYSRLSDGETAALIRWIRTLKPQDGGAGTVTARPLGRVAIALGKFRPAPAKMQEFATQTPIDMGAPHAAGRRLAANNCSECHGPALFGGVMEGDTMTPDLAIAGAYDFEQFKTLLRTGRTPSGKKLGLMAEVARNDFSHFTDAELRSLHGYLSARAEKLN